MNDQMTSTRREAYNALANLLTALGAGLGVWGVINLLEGCGNNHPAAQPPLQHRREKCVQLSLWSCGAGGKGAGV